MGAILKKSSILPLSSMICGASSIALYASEYGKPGEDRFHLATGMLMIALIPYTMKFLGPINDQFCREGETYEGNDKKWADLLSDWKKWHFPRVVLCGSLFAVSVYKLVK